MVGENGGGMGEETVARVIVMPLREVLDPQGEAVLEGLRALGFDEVRSVRVGRVIELRLPASDPDRLRRRIGAMCDQLLVNPVVEEARVEGLDGAQAPDAE